MTKHSLLADAPISQAELQDTLDKFTQTNCIFLCAVLTGFYTLITPMHFLVLPPALYKILAPLAVVTALCMLAIRYLLKTRFSDPQYINSFATIITALVFLNSILHLYLSQDPKQATNLMLLLVGVGFMHLNTRWYIWNVVYILAGGFIVSSLHGISSDNIHFGIGVILSALLSFFMHRSRVRNLMQVESWRIQSERRNKELEAALTDADKASRMAEASKNELFAALQALRKTKEKLEDRVQERTAELERSNRELQNFASIASHDLQEPLRKIQVFASRLKEKHGEALGESGQDYLERMLSAGERMHTLINDLLTFSRVTTKAKPFEPVDLANIVNDVISDLEIRIEQTNGRVEVGDLPIVQADPTQMRQLLQNLISNALKFHKPGIAPVVTIRSANEVSNCCIEISDNGIGFDQKYSEKIFAIFQRLHGRDEYEGTGIGLAVCRKIAERHGGTIIAHSEPQQGATFVITLPLQKPEQSAAIAA